MSRFEFYSIIVPSFNRKDEIRELIESFTKLDFPSNRFELIIADDGSADGTGEMVKDFMKQVEFPLHLYSQENKGPGAARNMGMEKAEGDFFIFIDSDCTVPPHWLIEIDQSLHAEEADAFGGPDSYKEDFPALLKAINYSMTSFITTGGIRGHSKKKLGKFFPRSFNMGLSRQVYNKVGGFGGLRHGQDIEFSNRIIHSGAKVISVPQAFVYHKRRTSIKKFFRQVFNWGVARINLFKIDSSMLEPVHALPAIGTIILALLIIGSLISRATGLILIALVLMMVVIFLLSGVHAAFKYRSPKLLLMVPIVMPVQIIGYGLGFLIAFTARVIFRRESFVGFSKRYYK